MKKHTGTSFFEPIFSPKSKEEIVKALQLTFGLDDREQHRDRLDYFRERRELVRQAIVNAEWLLEYISRIINLAIKPKGVLVDRNPNYYIVRFSLVSPNDCPSSPTWQIGIEKESDILQRLAPIDRTIDFSNDLAVSTLFNGSLAEIFLIIGRLAKNNFIRIDSSKEGNMYLKIVRLRRF